MVWMGMLVFAMWPKAMFEERMLEEQMSVALPITLWPSVAVVPGVRGERLGIG